MSATAGLRCVRERIVVGGLDGFTDEDVEIEGNSRKNTSGPKDNYATHDSTTWRLQIKLVQ